MRRLRLSLFLLLLTCTCKSDAATLPVGPTRTHTSICAAIDVAASSGDVVEIDGADGAGDQLVYSNESCTFNKVITLQGVGAKRPHVTSPIGSITNQGYFRPTGGELTVINIEASNARCNLNCQPIWPSSLSVTKFTLYDVYFHDNDNGFLTGNEVMPSDQRTIEVDCQGSEFARNGIGDGYSHNFYAGEIRKLTFKYNYSYDSNNGQLLKSRAGINVILYNWLVDSDSSGYSTSGGASNYEVDFPNGGRTYFIGNVVRQAQNIPPPGLPNGNMHLLLNAGEAAARESAGAGNVHQELYIINNTFISDRGDAVYLRDYKMGVGTLVVKNNIFAGAGDVLWNSTAKQTDPTGNSIFSTVAAAGFVNGALLDYRLQSSSSAIDQSVAQGVLPSGGGADTMSTDPVEQYAHPRTHVTRTTVGAALDHGALEYSVGGTAYISPVRLEYKNEATQVTLHYGSAFVESATVTGYKIFRNGSEIATASASAKTYSDTTGTPGLGYTYTVIPQGTPNGAGSNSVLAGRQNAPAATLGSGKGWHFIENSNFGVQSCTPPGNCLTYWAGNVGAAGAAMDNEHGRYFLWGGDWGARATNAVYAFLESTLSWDKLNADDAVSPGGEYYGGGTRPGQRWTVGGLNWLPTQGVLFSYGGFYAGSLYSTKTWEWHVATDTWTEYANGFDTSLDVGATAYNPTTGKMYVLAYDATSTSLREYTPDTHSYAVVKSGINYASYARVLVFDPTHNKLFYLGGNMRRVFDPANSYSTTDITHASCSRFALQNYPSVDFDVDRGVLVYWDREATVITYNPETGTCAEQTIVGQPDVGAGPPSNGFRYSTGLKVFWVASNNGNMAALRLSPLGHTGGTLRVGAKRGNTP